MPQAECFSAASAELTPLDHADLARLSASRLVSREERAEIGQFLTPAPTARFMSSLLRLEGDSLRVLDPGAGAGALTAALVERFCPEATDRHLELVAYENNEAVLPLLRSTVAACARRGESAGATVGEDVRAEDFLAAASHATQASLFTSAPGPFDCAILNPPYGKIRRGSDVDTMLRGAGVNCTNLYSAFLALTARLLKPGGEMVAIVPRSFCNGPYFRAFRRDFLAHMSFTHVHVFQERGSTFRDDAVLQENIIFRAVRTTERGPVRVSASHGSDESDMSVREAPHSELVQADDPDSFVRISVDELDATVARRMATLSHTLDDLGLTVSTGPVVDFRVRELLRERPGTGTVPLLYPLNLQNGRVVWPREAGRKAQAIVACDTSKKVLVPAGTYVLVKRFSAKEERRRVVPCVLRPEDTPGESLGLENHLNYFHRNGESLSPTEAYGLSAFLGSSLVDHFFRQFNGHTQVNATDLRSLRYPSAEQLATLGRLARACLRNQQRVDAVVQEVLFPMDDEMPEVDPIKAKRRIAEARDILRELGLPREQYNERSALVLLALLDMQAETPWPEASAALVGITPMMGHMAEHFGKQYAPNTRETVRRRTIHQFVQAGLVVRNPDDPGRPVNSALNVYQVNEHALAAIQCYGQPDWAEKLAGYTARAGTLKKRYAKERKMAQIEVEVAPGRTIALTPGGQNVLVAQIINEFLPRFTPGAQMVHVGDAGKKWAYMDESLLSSLGVEIDPHGQFPDVVVFHQAEGWLVLVEAVTAHGPVDEKRHIELRELFEGSTVGLVYVTAFMDRGMLAKYLREIAWETEVWTADAPDHLIHFDGERFLGPYEGTD